jgi:DNA-binding transcriptional ArsR family regulator
MGRQPLLHHPVRREILKLLRAGELTPSEIGVRLGRKLPGISHHLSALLSAGLVRVRTEGAHRLYAIDVDRVLGEWDHYVAGAIETE